MHACQNLVLHIIFIARSTKCEVRLKFLGFFGGRGYVYEVLGPQGGVGKELSLTFMFLIKANIRVGGHVCLSLSTEDLMSSREYFFLK